MKKIIFFLISVSVLLVSCSHTTVSLNESSKASPYVRFVDIDKFDRDLAASLTDSMQEVNVIFYDKISPNKTPERLQIWLSAVEKSGGVVRVEPPSGELVARDPFSLLSMLGSLWSAIKTGIELSQGKVFESTRGHDAVISLERNSLGEAVISKITFKRNVIDSLQK